MMKRVAKRKIVETVEISNLVSLSHYEPIASYGHLLDASTTGFLIKIERNDLVPKSLRQNLSLKSIEGEPIVLTISMMELEINGYIARTKYIGNGCYEIAIDFSQDAPEYWRECLFDLLPITSEFLQEEDV